MIPKNTYELTEEQKRDAMSCEFRDSIELTENINFKAFQFSNSNIYRKSDHYLYRINNSLRKLVNNFSLKRNSL